MTSGTDVARLTCPYCGEPIEVVIDLSVAEQEYIEDCYVCCRPITLSVTVEGEFSSVTARSENE